MSATVTWSFQGSPPCSWESLLGQGSISLKDLIPLPSHWSDHQSCNNLCVDLQSSPSCSSWDVAFSHPAGVWTWSMWFMPWRSVCWSWMRPTVISGSITWRALRLGWSAIWLVQCVRQGLWLHSVWAEQYCHEMLLLWLLQHQCYNLEWPLCKLQWLKLWCLPKWDCDLDQLCLSLSSWWCLKLYLAWWLLCIWGCVTWVPEGCILCGQSMTM